MHFSVFLGVWFAVERRRGNQKVKVGTAVVEHSTFDLLSFGFNLNSRIKIFFFFKKNITLILWYFCL